MVIGHVGTAKVTTDDADCGMDEKTGKKKVWDSKEVSKSLASKGTAELMVTQTQSCLVSLSCLVES